MRYRLIFTAWFDRDLKALRKHSPTLRSDFAAFLEDFDPAAHPIIPQTGGARKARMRTANRGKRGGYRVVYYFVDEQNTVWLLTIYDKVAKENLSAWEIQNIRQLIEQIRKG